jgi:hypothetical protein
MPPKKGDPKPKSACTGKVSRRGGPNDCKIARLAERRESAAISHEAVLTATLTAKGLEAGGFHGRGRSVYFSEKLRKISRGCGRTSFRRTSDQRVGDSNPSTRPTLRGEHFRSTVQLPFIFSYML